MTKKDILNTWELSNNDLKRVLNGVVKENALGDMNWANHSFAFDPETGAELLETQEQHRQLRLDRKYQFNNRSIVINFINSGLLTSLKIGAKKP